MFPRNRLTCSAAVEVFVGLEPATSGWLCSVARTAVAARDWVVVDEPALVGEDDGLDAVAKDELGEDVRDVRLDGLSR